MGRLLRLAAWLGPLLLVAAAFMKPGIMIEPGDLMAAHRSLAGDCLACHTLFRGVGDDRCIRCHRVADIGLVTTDGLPIAAENKNVGFHQSLAAPSCTACHGDHRGVQAYRAIQSFRHELLEPTLAKRCVSCHARPLDGFHGSLGDDCASCHAPGSWGAASFDHSRLFRFDRNHPATCSQCHPDGASAGYTCYGCHEHSRAGIRAEHREEGIRDFEACARCHRSGDEHEAKRAGERDRHRGGERDDD